MHTGQVTQKNKAESKIPLSSASAETVVLRALEDGRIHVTAHFRQRGREKGFDIIDAENVIRDGSIRGEPEYCREFDNWKYRFFGTVEESTLEIVVSLDPTEDYATPLVILLTGYWRD
jgi:hypothetical protein